MKQNPTMCLEEMAAYLSQNAYHAYPCKQISRALRSRGTSTVNIDLHVMHLNGPEREEFLTYTLLCPSHPNKRSRLNYSQFTAMWQRDLRDACADMVGFSLKMCALWFANKLNVTPLPDGLYLHKRSKVYKWLFSKSAIHSCMEKLNAGDTIRKRNTETIVLIVRGTDRAQE